MNSSIPLIHQYNAIIHPFNFARRVRRLLATVVPAFFLAVPAGVFGQENDNTDWTWQGPPNGVWSAAGN